MIFRSDRKKKGMLQIYVINTDGTGEKALTDDPNSVHWAPYWYKDGKHIIYTAADQSNPTQRPNFDLYWMNIETGKKTAHHVRAGPGCIAGVQSRLQAVDVDLDARRPATGPTLYRRL